MSKEEKQMIFKRAAELISSRDYKQAGDVLARAVDLCDIEDAQMLVTIDHYYRQTEDFEMRLKIVDKLLKFGVDPKSVMPFKVFHLSGLGRYKEALCVGEWFIRNFGSDNKVFEGLTRIYQDIGYSNQAVPYFEKLLPQADEMGLEKGLCYYSALINIQAYTNVYNDKKYKALLSRIYQNTGKFARSLAPSGGGYFKKLKVAYVSPDFRGHPIGYFIYPVIMETPECEHSICCFSLYQVEKDNLKNNMFGVDFSSDFKSRSDKYQVIEHMPDARKEKTIMREKPDIAFDLSSHTRANKLSLFAKRLAPIQISFIGWPSSTGIAAIDYTIVDAITDPPGAEEFYTEKLIRMSKTSLCHVLLPTEPFAPEPPVIQNRFITFGCFCNIQKLTPETITLMAQTVKSVKDARLIVKGRYSDEISEDMRKRFIDAGLQKNRLTIELQESNVEYLKSYHRIDIVLDTIPFNGATTTCDALNMGVPVVTLAGDKQSSRRGISILHNAGLGELIASTTEEYVKIATQLAADVKRLEFYRANLRKIKSESNLADAQAFVEEYLFHVRKTWVDCCREHKIPIEDYSQKTDAELKDEMCNAKRYIKYDSSEDVFAEYRRLEAEYAHRGITNEQSIG